MAKKTILQWKEWKSSYLSTLFRSFVQQTDLGQDTRPKEGEEGDKSNDTHITHDSLDTLLRAPQDDGQTTDDQHKVMRLGQ